MKLHIQALVADKMTVDWKHPKLKSINMANNCTGNEYNDYFIIIISPQTKSENMVFWEEVEYMGTVYKFSKNISVSTNLL